MKKQVREDEKSTSFERGVDVHETIFDSMEEYIQKTKVFFHALIKSIHEMEN